MKAQSDRRLYFAIDYVTFPALPSDVGRFHAQYLRPRPAKAERRLEEKLGPARWRQEEPRRRRQLRLLDAFAKAILWGSRIRGAEPGRPGLAKARYDLHRRRPAAHHQQNRDEDYYNGGLGLRRTALRLSAHGAPYIVDASGSVAATASTLAHESPITFEKSHPGDHGAGHANHRFRRFLPPRPTGIRPSRTQRSLLWPLRPIASKSLSCRRARRGATA